MVIKTKHPYSNIARSFYVVVVFWDRYPFNLVKILLLLPHPQHLLLHRPFLRPCNPWDKVSSSSHTWRVGTITSTFIISSSSHKSSSSPNSLPSSYSQLSYNLHPRHRISYSKQTWINHKRFSFTVWMTAILIRFHLLFLSCLRIFIHVKK